MHFRQFLALCGAMAVSVLAPSTAALAAGTSVSVRVEGKTKTLLAPTTVRTHSGSITKGGAPRGACPDTSALGALDIATRHRWSGPWSTMFNEFEIKSILGDTESTTHFYWGIWIDDRYATTGACEIKLAAGDRLLFAVDSVAHHEHPIEFVTPVATQHAGRAFTVKIVWFDDAGKRKPLAGVHVSARGVNAVTDRAGKAQISAAHAGTLVLHATHTGYIRAAPLRVHVS